MTVAEPAQVLERARKAEAEAAALKSQLKSETSVSKKSLREMETALAESTALSQKSEREYITLRDSIKGMVEGWKSDTDKLRDEMRKREEKIRREAEEVGTKYTALLSEVKASEAERGTVKSLQQEDERIRKEIEDGFRDEIAHMREEVERSSRAGDEALKTAKCVVLLTREERGTDRFLQRPKFGAGTVTKTHASSRLLTTWRSTHLSRPTTVDRMFLSNALLLYCSMSLGNISRTS